MEVEYNITEEDCVKSAKLGAAAIRKQFVWLALAGLGLLLLFVATSATAAEDSFSAALAKAKENTTSEAGGRYDEEFGASFGSRHAHVMSHCTAGASDADLETFDLVAKVSASGKIEKVLVRPETKVATCLTTPVTPYISPNSS
ncbi:MAG: hypothetical protein ACLQBD_01840 [Syntrophobacteraceae bacterium]